LDGLFSSFEALIPEIRVLTLLSDLYLEEKRGKDGKRGFASPIPLFHLFSTTT
jgi:hypothetical protein